MIIPKAFLTPNCLVHRRKRWEGCSCPSEQGAVPSSHLLMSLCKSPSKDGRAEPPEESARLPSSKPRHPGLPSFLRSNGFLPFSPRALSGRPLRKAAVFTSSSSSSAEWLPGLAHMRVSSLSARRWQLWALGQVPRSSELHKEAPSSPSGGWEGGPQGRAAVTMRARTIR